jgi:DivIVA domain-containing protein
VNRVLAAHRRDISEPRGIEHEAIRASAQFEPIREIPRAACFKWNSLSRFAVILEAVARREQSRGSTERRRVPGEIRFPVAVRGYDRRAVDAYVTRVNRLIAELEATRSPEAAVKRALERAEAQTRGILERTRGEAEEITARARAEAADIVVNASTEADRSKEEADQYVAKATTEAEAIVAKSRSDAAERLQRSQEEIATLREEAEAWVRELRADTAIVWGERRELLGDLHEIAMRLEKAASRSASRSGSGNQDPSG